MLDFDVVLKSAASSMLGMAVRVDAEVDYAPYAVEVPGSPINGLSFHVFDKTNTELLGIIENRTLVQWTDEINGKGLGRLTAYLKNLPSPLLLEDDNVIRVHYQGDYRFAWRVKAGTDEIVNSSEEAGEIVGMDGPGGLDVLEEAIVYPEWPFDGEPTKSSQDRYFGYMSKAGTTTATLSDPEYNLVTKPIVDDDGDWLATEGDTSGTPSVQTDGGLADYESWRWTYSSTGSARLSIVQVGADPIPVTPYGKISMSVMVRASAPMTVRLAADFDTANYATSPYILYPDEDMQILFEEIIVPASASEVRLRLIFDGDYTSGDTLDVYWPMVNTGARALDYFDGDSRDRVPSGISTGHAFVWMGATNASLSRHIMVGNMLANEQPTWYNPVAWSGTVKGKRKSKIKKGTAKAAPDDWSDPTAYAIWPSDPEYPSNPGTVYWRHEFDMPKKAAVFVQAAADNQLRVWLDGVEIITEGFNGDATDITGSWDGTISKGKHLIAAETTNFAYSKPEKNFGWFLATVMYKQNNEPVGVVSNSRTSWKAFYEGDTNVPTEVTTTTTTSKTGTGSKKVNVTYTVRRGDTLSSIGRKFGVPWRDIYNLNKAKIDARAAASGLPNNGPGWWIFPGQVLKIPGKYTTTGSSSSKSTTTTTKKWVAGEPLTTKQPGWLPYQILAQLVLEGQERGVSALQGVQYGFTFGYDSDGIPWGSSWEDVVDRSFRIGDSVYDAAQDLVEGGMDIRMGPDYTLHAYRKMGQYRGITTDPEYQFVLLDKGGTTLDYSVDKRTDRRNFILIDTDKGWRSYSNEESDLEGRSEASASLGGVNADKMTQAIGDQLEELGISTKTVTTTFHVVEGRRPYVDFDLGDIVVGHDILGRPFDVRIVSMSIVEQENSLFCTVVASGEDLS